MKLYPNITIIFIIWALTIFSIFTIGFYRLPHGGNMISRDNVLTNLRNWDGGHFVGIAENGYKYSFQYAFFPLYPILIMYLTKFTESSLLASLIISITSTYLGLNMLYELMVFYFADKKLAEKVILGILFFPTSFYFLTAYSEGLFFFLSVATFFFLRKNNLLLATIAVSLASATRLVGLGLVLAFLTEILVTRGLNRKNWFVLLAPLGFLIYCLYLFQVTGDPFYFLKAETNWQRSIVFPGQVLFEGIGNIFKPGFISGNFQAFLDMIFAIFGLIFSLRVFRFLPISYGIYALILIAVPLFTQSLTSMPRFLLPIFPIFICIALIKNYYFFLGFQLFSIMLLALYAVLFINGYWVS